jgi:hypothetical protein
MKLQWKTLIQMGISRDALINPYRKSCHGNHKGKVANLSTDLQTLNEVCFLLIIQISPHCVHLNSL